jgi:catechol 2,3-dioxygenase
MIDASVQTAVRSDPVLPLSTRLGPVHIAVTDRERALATWRDVVGLDLIEESGNLLSLGAGGTVLIVLEAGAARPVVPRTLGLYHVALHVPKRTDLAQFVLRALQHRVRIAPTDRLVSEAVYLWDPDGNGIEMTFETPWRGHLGDPEQGAYAIAADGRPHSGRDPIDVDGLLAELGDNPVLEPRLPAGTRVGHVHVHVGDLDDAMRFYRDIVGFGGFMLIRSFGMGDVGRDYMPHTIAFNIWSGASARQAPEGSAGLRWFTIVVPDAETLAGVRQRVETAGGTAAAVEKGFATTDPAGNLVHIVTA